MKKRTVKVLVCAALMSLSLSATACGGSDSGAKSEDAATEAPAAEEEAPAEEEAKEEAPAEEEAPEAEAEEESSTQKTLEEYLKEDPEAMKQIEEQAAAEGNDQMDMSIEVVGNDLTCVATFKDSVEIPEGTVEILETGMSELEPAFSAIAGALDDEIGAEKGTVSYGVKYCDSEGNVLVEASFKAQ